MWAIDPERPCHPLEVGEPTQNYVTLNVTMKDDPFVGPDIFTFERITWEQDIDNETTE
jgi:hypothetical protein